MHIEPDVVSGTKIWLSYATAAAAGAVACQASLQSARQVGLAPLAARCAIATGLVFVFFEVLPHFPVGVSEVHFIFGSTLFLLFGLAPTAIGLALGLLLQGLFFAPADLPQYGMNVTTLLVPLFATAALADRIIKPNTPYVEITYAQALALSTTYQAGIVAWVAFWAFYGGGFAASNVAAIATFSVAYMLVVLIEPLADLAILFAAKMMRRLTKSPLFTSRLHAAALSETA